VNLRNFTQESQQPKIRLESFHGRTIPFSRRSRRHAEHQPGHGTTDVRRETEHRSGNDVPAWLLDSNYNGRCFHVSQAFFPRTSAWDNLKKALKGEYDESVWEHLAGDTSAAFEVGDEKQIAVKVIDDRGNELIVTKMLNEAV